MRSPYSCSGKMFRSRKAASTGGATAWDALRRNPPRSLAPPKLAPVPPPMPPIPSLRLRLRLRLLLLLPIRELCCSFVRRRRKSGPLLEDSVCSLAMNVSCQCGVRGVGRTRNDTGASSSSTPTPTLLSPPSRGLRRHVYFLLLYHSFLRDLIFISPFAIAFCGFGYWEGDFRE